MSNDVVICLFASSGYDRAAQGVAGAGRDLAGQLGGSLRAVIVGPSEDSATSAVAAAADTVTVLDQPELGEYQPELILAALHQACEKLDPAAVLLGSDTASLELTARLAALHEEGVPGTPDTSVEVWRGMMSDYLQRPLPEGRRLLLVLDGVDEAADWEAGADLFPRPPPEGGPSRWGALSDPIGPCQPPLLQN